jgi:lipopolysaccharide biosynthesis protein
VKHVKLIAFHLTQFHPIPENDTWWGKGFTEWTNVLRGQPVYPRHRQPQLPGELGFYDLRDDRARAAQAALARRFEINGFCYYYYWFGGKRLLEQPIEAMLAGGSPDIPFCLCWANENWTRRWDGKNDEILIAQNHSPDDDIAMIKDVIRYFRDPRYIRVNGKPMMLIYRTDLLPDSRATACRWRDECRRAGIGEIYLCVVRRFDMPKHGASGFDAMVDFPPHGHVSAQLTRAMRGIATGFKGHIFDYRDLVRDALARLFRSRSHLPNYPGVMPSWDNTARRRARAHIFHGATPLRYRAWLAETIRAAVDNTDLAEPIVFINSWNEWAEGCHLEPDQEYGMAWLEATRAARIDAAQGERLWARYGIDLPELPPEDERQLAGAPLEQVLASLPRFHDCAPQPTRYDRVVAEVRRRVETRPGLRRTVILMAKLLDIDRLDIFRRKSGP